MRTIDADALFREMEKAQWYNNADRDEIAEELVLNAPTIEPRTKGKWKMALTKDLIGFNTVCFRCSECNSMEYSTSPFCRVCGAKMEEGEADETD